MNEEEPRPENPSPSGPLPSDRHSRRLVRWARQRFSLVKESLGSAVQVGLAAGISWWAAITILPWDDPLYAPIGAVVAIGTGEDRLISRPLRLLGGMIVAVAVAGVVVGRLGSGVWQIVLITTVTTVIGRFLFDDALARTYSAFHGAVIAALGVNRVIPEQLIEASLGAVIGIVIVHLIFPPRVESALLSPVEYGGYAARRSLRAVAAALRSGHQHEVRRALQAAQDVEARLAPDDKRWTFVRQLVRFAPARWQERHRVEDAIETDRKLSSLLLDVASLARLSQRLTEREPRTHPELSAAVEELDIAVGWVLRQPFEHPDQVDEAIERLQRQLGELGDTTRPQDMLCENLQELSEDIAGVTRQLANRSEDQ